MTGEERKQADEFLETQTKPTTGILWKLSPEEREALGRVCSMARVYCTLNNLAGSSNEMRDIKQLLGEEKEAPQISKDEALEFIQWIARLDLQGRQAKDMEEFAKFCRQLEEKYGMPVEHIVPSKITINHVGEMSGNSNREPFAPTPGSDSARKEK